MSRAQLRRALFASHLADLRDVVPEVGEIFVCPICFGVFNEGDLDAKRVNDGHVWPELLRAKSKGQLARTQQVLLCHDCNSGSGSHGDRQMQLLEEIRDAEKGGRYHGERRVQAILGPHVKPIEVRAQVTILDPQNPGDLRINFPVDRRTKDWARTNPAEQRRFEELLAQGQTFSLAVYPHHEYKPNLAIAGWITAGYLQAFFRLGYRYVLQPTLAPIRQYILESFEVSAKEALKLPDLPTFSAGICDVHYAEEPALKMVAPLDGETPIHLQIDFLDHHVKLPCEINLQALHDLIEIGGVDLEALPEEASIDTSIQCSKTIPHECVWDFVLGKSLYSEDEESG